MWSRINEVLVIPFPFLVNAIKWNTRNALDEPFLDPRFLGAYPPANKVTFICNEFSICRVKGMNFLTCQNSFFNRSTSCERFLVLFYGTTLHLLFVFLAADTCVVVAIPIQPNQVAPLSSLSSAYYHHLGTSPANKLSCLSRFLYHETGISYFLSPHLHLESCEFVNECEIFAGKYPIKEFKRNWIAKNI